LVCGQWLGSFSDKSLATNHVQKNSDFLLFFINKVEFHSTKRGWIFSYWDKTNRILIDLGEVKEKSLGQRLYVSKFDTKNR
jgi:hypothetical protein